jgi:hypothetical protein
MKSTAESREARIPPIRFRELEMPSKRSVAASIARMGFSF